MMSSVVFMFEAKGSGFGGLTGDDENRNFQLDSRLHRRVVVSQLSFIVLAHICVRFRDGRSWRG